jgi:phosphoglycolate phosphatase
MPVVLVDLDGTLVDSGPGIAACAADAFRAVGRPVPAEAELRSFIGPPIKESLRRSGVPEPELDAAVAGFRSRFAEMSIIGAKPYPGVRRALEQLRLDGYRLILTTSKPEMFAVPICAHFGLDSLLDGIVGAPPDPATVTKAAIIAKALLDSGGGPAVVVGDRYHDVLGARENGLDCLGAAWGYAADGELLRAGAVEVILSPDRLVDAVPAYFGNLFQSAISESGDDLNEG